MIETKRWYINASHVDLQDLAEPAELLRSGYTVSFPTETVYGLGADATNRSAVSRIFAAKGRPEDNPLIAHVATKKQLKELVIELPGAAETLFDTFMPGPLTLVLTSNGVCAENVTAGLPSIGVRLPAHPVARALLEMTDRPVAAPSANLSGKPSPTTAQHVWDDLEGSIAGLIDAGPTGVGVESTVVDCTQDVPVILRPGGVTKEQLEDVVGTVMLDPSLAGKTDNPKAPGMKYTHYAPEVPMYLVDDARKMQAVIDREAARGKRVGVMAADALALELHQADVLSLGTNLQETASHIYDALRQFKHGDVDLILCEAFPETGIGQAIMNRLEKAAAGYIDE